MSESSTALGVFIIGGERSRLTDRLFDDEWNRSILVPQRAVRCSKPIFRPRLTTYPRKARVCVCLCVSLSVDVCVRMKWMGALLGRNRRNGTERNVAIYSRALITSNLPAVINHRRWSVGRSRACGGEDCRIRTRIFPPGKKICIYGVPGERTGWRRKITISSKMLIFSNT